MKGDIRSTWTATDVRAILDHLDRRLGRGNFDFLVMAE